MPLIESCFIPPRLLAGGHSQTLWPVLFRPRIVPQYVRQRLELPDGDFIDLDWTLAAGPGEARSGKMALVIHGLEGHAHRKYVLGMAQALRAAGWDICALNHRGCSGEPNRLPRTYHSGETDDVHTALESAIAQGPYAQAALVGFSMGGNQVAKYLGEDPGRVPGELCGAVAVSAPLDLEASVTVLERGASRLYQAYLMRSLKEKIRAKHTMHPSQLPLDCLPTMRTFREFDDTYTAPLHGFADASDYYARCSGGRTLDAVAVPLLVLNAADDPFLGPECFPQEIAQQNPALFLEMPSHGGHVGFVPRRGWPSWPEVRAVEFLGGCAL